MERFTHDSLQVMIFMIFTLIKNNFKTTFYLNQNDKNMFLLKLS